MMNRLARWAMRLYPSTWRKRYGEEITALVDDTGADARVTADLLKEAIRMQFSTWSFLRLAAVLGLAGIVAGTCFTLFTPTQYTARTDLTLTGSDSPDLTRSLIANQIMSRQALSTVINDPKLQLYRDELRTEPLFDVAGQMKANTGVFLDDPTHISVRFTYPDKSKALLATREIARDAARIFQTPHSTAEGPLMDVIDTATLPDQPLHRNLFVAGFIGLIAGILLAVVFRFRKMATAVVLVSALAGVASAWLPLRYESKATMFASNMSAPTVDALVAMVSSRTSMGAMISDPRLQLYREELKQRTLDDVAVDMRHDVAITSRSSSGGGRWIDISFIYPDPAKCQQVVQAIMNRLDEANMEIVRMNHAAPRMIDRGIVSYSDGDAVTIETTSPDRATPVFYGFLAGLGLAALIAAIRHRWRPEEDTAPKPRARLTFHPNCFRKLAVWFTTAGIAAGAVIAWCSPLRYTSDALISFENADPAQVATWMRGIGRLDLTWQQREPGATFQIQSVSNNPETARAGVQDALRTLDQSLFHLHGGNDKSFDPIRGVDGALLPVTSSTELQAAADDSLVQQGRAWPLIVPTSAVPRPPASSGGVAAMSFGPTAVPRDVADVPDIPATPIDSSLAAIPFDDDRARPVPEPQFHAVRMNVIDPPALPSRSHGLGWQAIALGGAGGLFLAALFSLRAGFGRVPAPHAHHT